MNDFVKWLDNAPILIKIIFALPALDIIWVIYRLAKSLSRNNTLGIILAIILLIVGLPWLWLLDIITLLLDNRVLWFD